jgi:beta-lactamase class A
MFFLNRRAVLAGAALAVARPALAQNAAPPWRKLKDLEVSTGARVGVAAIDTASGLPLYWRESERFNMCSTFKLLLAAAVLARGDGGKEDLGRVVHYQASDLLDVSPMTKANVAAGMRIDALCEAAIRYSDNTAANLLLASMGGPQGLTPWLRGLGDEVTRIDRIEPALNIADGDKDTTTPAAMLGTLKTMLLGDALSPASRARLGAWLAANTTGANMLRAGLPAGWEVGDKTGHWMGHGSEAVNDLAIVTPPGRKPILVAAFTRGGSDNDDARVAVLAAIGRIVGEAFSDSRIALR